MITGVIAQLRTTNLRESIAFYTATLGFTLEFQYEDFYAGIRAGEQMVHLKLVDAADPSIAFVREGEHFDLYFGTDDLARAADSLHEKGVPFVQAVHETAWGTREFVINDDQSSCAPFCRIVRQKQGPRLR